MAELDDLLHRADPASRWNAEEVEQRVWRASLTAKQAPAVSRKTPWKRPAVLVPLLLSGVVLMGAAVVAPLQLWVKDQEVQLDVQLPIEYTTVSGREVSCKYGLYFDSAAGRTPEIDAAMDKLRGMDFSGLGKEIYQYAVDHPASPQEGETWNVDNASVREKIAFELAVRAVVTDRLSGILPAGAGFSGTTDCAGQLS